MKGIRFVSTCKNAYFYDNKTGLIYPERDVSHVPEVVDDKAYVSPFATESDIIRYLAVNGYKQLLLEMTQVCNLRCLYCCYGEHYPSTRNHGNTRMSFEVARKAVDLYMSHFIEIRHINPVRNPVISFYGGEPLVNFSLIKEVIAYVKTTYPQYVPDYNITTNGLLLSDEVADILVENKFSIIVSLDGDKENHDRNRRKIDGQGSFDEVFGNIARFKKNHPGYGKFGMSTCFDYNTDLEKLADFMKENDLFVVLTNMVSHQETDYYKKFSAETIERFNNQLSVMRKKYFDLAKKDGILLSERSFMLSLFAFGYLDFACHSVLEEKRPDFLPYTGSCIPGEKMYVTVTGDLHMCERISPRFAIGHVESGIHVEKVAGYINQFNKFSEKCRECDISRLCDICMARATDKDEIALPADYCRSRYEYIQDLLVSYVDLMEAKPGQFEDIVISYYDDMRERIGNILD